ncbi:MAG TPA: hypothetical protein VFA75_10005 [Nevskia sp.]|nr:hypothetical protein [Nevskia sp.]
MKYCLFKLAMRANEAEIAQDRLKTEMRRVYREHVSLEEIAEASGMPVPRVASIVGAPQPGSQPGTQAAP